jgi:hypothetical protein
MDWFNINPLTIRINKPSKHLKKTFSCDVIQKIEDGTALYKFNLDRVLKKIHNNRISKRVSETHNYSDKLESLLKLKTLHYTKKQFNDLEELCNIRSRYLSDEIYKIEQKYVEPTYVNYGLVHYPKRTYMIDGKEYTTYRGSPHYNGPFFAAITVLVISGFFFY